MAVAQPRTGALAGPFDADGGRRPASYRLRVFLLDLLGCGYILGVPALLAAAIAATLYAAAGTRGSHLGAVQLVFALSALGLVVVLVSENTRFRRPLQKVAGAEVYRR
jgi:hypothetical protein